MSQNYSDIKQTVIKNIKYYREKAGYTARDSSLIIGKKDDFIDKLEKGMYSSKFISIMLVDKIAGVLNIPIAKFLMKRNEKSDTK